jgi:hypothetical protein
VRKRTRTVFGKLFVGPVIGTGTGVGIVAANGGTTGGVIAGCVVGIMAVLVWE